jgi:hypothetical protein
MKKLLFTGLIALILFSCKSTTATKLDTKSEVAIKGNWKITSVNYPGAEMIAVTSFGIADAKCFEGSNWKFVSNNNKGEMALTKLGCPVFDSDITWYINKEGNMILKILEGDKAKTVKEGYVLKVSNQSDNSFQLIDKINVAGKITDVVYQFEKMN